MDKTTINITADSVLEMVSNLTHAERILGRNPNKVLLSEMLASRCIFELQKTSLTGGILRVKHLKGSTLLGLDVEVILHDNSDFIRDFEGLK